jgi:outer membrane receptor protein involved in Fe transport
MINELIDVYAAEVLRGPQGTLFGKNTASGAINIRTVAPDPDTPNAFVELTAGDLDLQRISAAGNIRLSDNAAIRATVFSSQRDGYVDNYTYDFGAPFIGVQKDVFNDRNRWGARVQLAYDNDDDFNLRLILDYAEIDEVCCAGISRIDSLFAQDALTRGIVAPGSDYARSLDASGALFDTTFTTFPYLDYLAPFFPPNGLPPTVVQGVRFEDYVTAQDILPSSQNEDQGISLEMNKTLDNGVTLTSVSAFRSFDTYDYIDVDFTDTALADRYNDASQHSFSQELRFAGEFGESSNWVAGAYYFQQTIKSNTRTTGGSDFPAYVFAVEPELLAFYTTLAGAGVPVTLPAPAGMYADDIVNQDHDGYAVFGQIDWALSDQFIATLGVRYTDETKKINTVYTQTHNAGEPNFAAIIGYLLGVPGIGPEVLIPVTADAGWGAYQYAPFSPRDNVNEKLEDDQVTGTAKLTWYPVDGQMVYASYSTGFKSGGTNADRIWDNRPQTFAAETSESIEVGYKGDIGERMRLSLALYQTDYDDFQAQSFAGTGFYLQNAGKIETQGAEVEFLWQVLDHTTLSGFYARNEGDYVSFEEGVCWDAWSFHMQMMRCRATAPEVRFPPIRRTATWLA